ncbi:MAG: hypothetical protein NVSMB46_01470 [Candidatus Saccharimonadales bacterium]
MNNTQGRYIVLEGPEGVGKTSQLQLIADQLKQMGYHVRIFREPDSQSDLTARAIRTMTQDPKYPMNTRTEVLLYNAARSQSLQIIRNAREKGVLCLVDRNYLTTLAIQYYGRGDVPDYLTINSIINFAVDDMEPDLTIVLDAPVSVLMERAKERGQGERFDNLDASFLDRVRAGYLWEAKQRKYPVLHAIGSKESIANEIVSMITSNTSTNKETSPNEPPIVIDTTLETTNAKSNNEMKSEDYLKKLKNGSYSITDAGTAFLEEAITSSTDNVYAFTDKLSSITIAAAMARLSRRGDDMRVTILDEFAKNAGKDEKLLQRVISAYGDDSVQQLIGQHIVVEGASNLLTKKLEWGRMASYLEQSTRYIYFDQKDQHGRYKYFTPEYLENDLKEDYVDTMDQIFDLYSSMVHKLSEYIRSHSTVPKEEQDSAWMGATRAQACDAVRAVLPVATKSTVGIYASGQALESLIMHLLADELTEAWEVGQKILKHARKVIPTFLERADKPDRGGAIVAYRASTQRSMRKLAQSTVPQNHAVLHNESVELDSVWPRNELDIIPDMLYEYSNLPLQELRKITANWDYSQKLAVFNCYIGERLNRRHKPGRALEKIHYSWDLICDYGIFRDLQRHRMVDDLEWQLLTPRYGYEVPEIIEQANLTDMFEECFDLSMSLHSKLQEKGYALEAQYATLLGHKMRWKVTYNAREAFHLHELRTSPQGHPGYRKLVLAMHEKVAEVHPLLADAMRFVNSGEDPELSRLAAERYTQFKLGEITK